MQSHQECSPGAPQAALGVVTSGIAASGKLGADELPDR
jgi:hypothetical protein